MANLSCTCTVPSHPCTLHVCKHSKWSNTGCTATCACIALYPCSVVTHPGQSTSGLPASQLGSWRQQHHCLEYSNSPFKQDVLVISPAGCRVNLPVLLRNWVPWEKYYGIHNLHYALPLQQLWPVNSCVFAYLHVLYMYIYININLYEATQNSEYHLHKGCGYVLVHLQ